MKDAPLSFTVPPSFLCAYAGVKVVKSGYVISSTPPETCLTELSPHSTLSSYFESQGFLYSYPPSAYALIANLYPGTFLILLLVAFTVIVPSALKL